MAAKNIGREEFKELLASGKPFVVDFWAPWCGYCRRIGPAFEKIAEQRNDLDVVKLNVVEVPGVDDEYGVEYIPTLILFNGGKELARVTAPGSKAAIDEFIEGGLYG